MASWASVVALSCGCSQPSQPRTAADSWTWVRRSCTPSEISGVLSPVDEPQATRRQCSAVELQLAQAVLEREATASESATTSRRAGVVALYSGDLARARRWLLKSAEVEPAVPETWNDLSVLYLTQATRTKALDEVVRAVDAASRATELTTPANEATRNLRLAWERLGFVSAGATAREDVVANATTPDLPGHLTAVDPDILAEIVERHLAKDWASAVIRRDVARAAAALASARAAALAVTRSSGDRSVEALIEELAVSDSDVDRRQVNALTWLAYLDAQTAFEADDVEGAARILGVRYLRSPAGAATARVSLLRAAIARVTGDTAAALRLVNTQPGSEFEQFPVLDARRRWQRGLLLAETGRIGDARVEYATARETFRRFRDREGEAMTSALLAAGYADLENWNEAWVHQARANALLNACRRMRRESIITSASALASAMGLYRAAIAFRQPAAIAARTAGAVSALAFLLTDDALDRYRLGEQTAALHLLDDAAVVAATITDPGVRDMFAALHAANRGMVLAESDPLRAERLFGEAVARYRARGSEFGTADVLLRQGLVLRKLGLGLKAERAFRDGVSVTRRQARSLASPVPRAELRAARWALYRGLASSLMDRGQTWQAHGMIENARSEDTRWEPVSTGAGLARLQPNTVWLSFVELEGKVAAWLVSSTARKSFVIMNQAGVLDRTVDALRLALTSNQLDSPEAHSLFDHLLGPVRAELARADTLVVCGDGPILRVPFAALRDRNDGRLLVERVAVVTAPVCPGRSVPPRGHSRVGANVLVAGDADRSSQPDTWQRLRHTLEEITQVSSLYRRAVSLTGSQVTRRDLLSHLSDADVFHFAGHSVAHPFRSDLSRLALTPTEDDVDGAIFASDIAALPVAPRLVVLAACETGGGVPRQGAGVVGLAGAFLAAGSETVIATLWPVPDADASIFFVELHRRLAQGLVPAEALRQVQLSFLTGRRNAAMWSAVVAVGKP